MIADARETAAIEVGRRYVLAYPDRQATVDVRAIVAAGRGETVHFVPASGGYYPGRMAGSEFRRRARPVAA